MAFGIVEEHGLMWLHRQPWNAIILKEHWFEK